MPADHTPILDHSNASLIRRGDDVEQVELCGSYLVICTGPDGVEKWRESFDNLVTTLGKNDLLNTYFRAAIYSQTIRMGLKGAGAIAVGDTQASHAGWLEVGLANAPIYTGNRKDVLLAAASGGSASAPLQSFAITSSGVVAGAFMNNGGSATKDDTTGVLYSVGDFTNGPRSVDNGDTLQASYTASC